MSQVGIDGERNGHLHEERGITDGRESAVLLIAYEYAGRYDIGHDHGQAAGYYLDHYVIEGLGQTRKEKRVS